MPPTRLDGQVRVTRTGALITISLHGCLDANAGVELLATLQGQIDAAPPRIDVDLMAVEAWTPEGARSLRRARSLAQNLSDGLHFRTTTGVGHEALLAAFDEAETEP
jgi:hypothetical protein